MIQVPTPIADMITEMLKNCIPIEMIIFAVRSMERASTRQTVDETAEKRRAWDREYRRKKRDIPPDQPDIHPTTPDTGNIALTFLSENKKLSEVVSKESKKEKKEKKERGCKIPPDWIPKDGHYDEGKKRGMTRDVVDDLAETMRTWAAANANRSVTTKADWDATFMGFIRKENRNGYGSGNGRANQASGPAPTRDTTIITGMARALERRRENRAAAEPEREEFRGRAGAAGAHAAEPGAAPGDDEPPRQLALLPAGNSRA